MSGGTGPMWAHNGREIFYLNGRQELVTNEVRPGPTFSIGEPRVLLAANSYEFTPNYQLYDISPDDRRFIMVRAISPEGGTELILTENWFQELKARASR